MHTQILSAASLVVFTVAIHALGFAVLIRFIVRSHTLAMMNFWPVTGMVIVLACWLLLIHLVEIAIWGLFYFWQGCLPDAESAFYFSAVTCSIGSDGELALPRQWRMLAPLEALTSILMYGLSTGLFFALVIRWIGQWVHLRAESEHAPPVTGNK